MHQSMGERASVWLHQPILILEADQKAFIFAGIYTQIELFLMAIHVPINHIPIFFLCMPVLAYYCAAQGYIMSN